MRDCKMKKCYYVEYTTDYGTIMYSASYDLKDAAYGLRDCSGRSKVTDVNVAEIDVDELMYIIYGDNWSDDWKKEDILRDMESVCSKELFNDLEGLIDKAYEEL